MIRISTIISLLALATSLYATQQEPDILIINNDTFYLETYPLDSLNLTSRPFRYTTHDIPSTACWRGYRAVWKIVDGKLYLESILTCKTDHRKRTEDIIGLFERNKIEFTIENDMVFAVWVTLNLYAFSTEHENYLCEGHFIRKKHKDDLLSLVIKDGIVVINKI